MLKDARSWQLAFAALPVTVLTALVVFLFRYQDDRLFAAVVAMLLLLQLPFALVPTVLLRRGQLERGRGWALGAGIAALLLGLNLLTGVLLLAAAEKARQELKAPQPAPVKAPTPAKRPGRWAGPIALAALAGAAVLAYAGLVAGPGTSASPWLLAAMAALGFVPAALLAWPKGREWGVWTSFILAALWLPVLFASYGLLPVALPFLGAGLWGLRARRREQALAPRPTLPA